MDRIQKRFDELDAMTTKIVESYGKNLNPEPQTGLMADGTPWSRDIDPEVLDTQLLIQWQTSVLSLLGRVFESTSATYGEFLRRMNRQAQDPIKKFEQMRSVFLSAKADYEGGYLFNIRNLVHKEVFSNELEQAEHFSELGHEASAAVTAGVVLETTIKRVCDQNAIDVKNEKDKDIKTDTLITELKSKNVCNEAVAKQLRAWMGVRNDAAHGKRKDGDFEQGEVSRMIQGVGDFVAKHMS